MQSDFLQLAIAFAGYVCIGFCVYMISRKMLVDIDRKERAEEILVWIFFGAVWPLGIMFAATFLRCGYSPFQVISIEKKPDIDTIVAGA
ncbi:hypothetical protein [Escherichia coli]|uniref:hypothetical protein n=1 Tax=Escherichia coli TaxID=562 RepID=UPI000AC34BE9|nr:hypothetical protein [Escherichia coli]GCG39200.1 hypothetical protein BvCms14BK_04426 [Escherichia coli]GCG42803.1 hypothetical protein BvCms16BK_00838 [Escherichia coli]GDR06333.1 hypothetical protein BvCmsNSP046_00907 [Escherichia coli]